MRDKFWKLYERVIYIERYYWHYRQRAIRIDRGIKAFLLIASLSGFAGFWLWNRIPHVWSVIALIAQVFSACAYLLPHSDQISSINYLAPELQRLLNRVDHDWDNLDSLTYEDINDLVLKYNNELLELEDKYAHGISFPENKRIKKKAEAESKEYKFSQLDITEFAEFKEEIKNGD